jgi:probable F420-dependent oxidoreductase
LEISLSSPEARDKAAGIPRPADQAGEPALKIGVFLGDEPFGSDDVDGFIRIARAAEEAGFDSLWMGDHPVRPAVNASVYPYSPTGKPAQRSDDSLFDPIVTLAALATATTRVTLGTAVYILPLRHPLITARQVMTLDRVSQGRVLFGVGAGWLEEEFTALGVPFDKRGRQMDDALRLLRRLWTEDTVESGSETYPFASVMVRPRPVQHPHPPILVGGHSPAAIRRAARLGDGWVPVAPDLSELSELLQSLDRALRVEGRSREGFIVDARTPKLPTYEMLRQYEQLGLTGVRIHGADLAGLPLHECTVDDVLTGLHRWSEIVLQRF